MKVHVLVLAGAILLGLLTSRAEARCPSNEGVFSDCAASTCSAEQCAAQGLECCPKPCGGTWCVKGVSDHGRHSRDTGCPRRDPPRGGCRGPPVRLTCSTVYCRRGPCCTDGCGKPYCHDGRG
ncbi:unnamed protein product [Ixodes hexagonus]